MTSDQQRYQRVDRVVDQAIALPSGERASFLDRECADDPKLRWEVELLLSALAESDDFLESHAFDDLARELAQAEAKRLEGSVLGRYRVGVALGSGGMGQVFSAVDESLGREVALKVLPQELARDPDRIRRLRREAKTVSALNHPNIVTLYEIVEAEGTIAIATERVVGETLRQRMDREPIELAEAISITRQIAAALACAHTSGIVHCDLKPENVMVRSDGIVKVLDFGIARAFLRPGLSIAPAGSVERSLEAGIFGTPGYLSPEQARGLPLDGRSDIFSLGILLYEMTTGSRPFAGETPMDQIAAVLERDLPPPSQRVAELPAALDTIVARALRRDLDQRYQEIGELLRDLDQLANARTDSAASSAVGTTRAARRWAAAALLVAVLGGGLAAVRWLGNGGAPLGAEDTIVLAELDNGTGELVFDRALDQALAFQIGQSPFLVVLSSSTVSETLGYMGASGSRLTIELAREVGRRAGAKAVLGGSIERLGSRYVILLEALASETGETLARELVEVASQEAVIGALGRAASRMRRKLGESLRSIAGFDADIEQVTTPSLEALRAYALGVEHASQGRYFESMPFFERALDLDPEFALAHVQLGRVHYNVGDSQGGVLHSEEAFRLKDRTSDRERLKITYQYQLHTLGDLEHAVETLEIYRRTYPRDHSPLANLSFAYSLLGDPRRLDTAREAVASRPKNVVPYNNLAFSQIAMGQLEEARATLAAAVERGLDPVAFGALVAQLDVLAGDLEAPGRLAERAFGTPYEPSAVAFQAEVEAGRGRLARSRELVRRAAALAEGSDPEVAARIHFESSLRAAAYGRCAEVAADAARVEQLSENKWFRAGTALARAICGEGEESRRASDRLAELFPHDVLVSMVARKATLAVIALLEGEPRSALDLLEGPGRYERGAFAGMWPAYLRGLTLLELGDGALAVREFDKLVSSPGQLSEAPHSPPRALALLGRARAWRLAGDAGSARADYQELFELWRDADPDLEALRAAQQEEERLGPLTQAR